MLQEQIRLPKGVTVRGPLGKRYVIERLLGEGGSGAVYLVSEQHARHTVFALKEVICPNKHDRERFVFECEVLKRLDHRALPRVHRMFEQDQLKRVYILMDYIQGRDLEVLRQEQPDRRFALPLALALMAPVVDALSYLHHQDPPIVHRDIKPANIIVPRGAAESMLVDFGSAKEYTPNATTVALRHRAPGYAVPEQYSSGTTPRTDVYALGATFYTLLTGTVPPDAITRATKSWSPAGDPLKPADLLAPTVPTAVAQALERAMALRSIERFETVAAFWQALTADVPEQQELRSGTKPIDPPRLVAEQDAVGRPTTPMRKQRPVPLVFRRGALLPILTSLLAIIALDVAFLSQGWNLAALLLPGLGALLLLLLLWLIRQ
jgi:eukaryotic-like serine/threonine-protein kinase